MIMNINTLANKENNSIYSFRYRDTKCNSKEVYYINL